MSDLVRVCSYANSVQCMAKLNTHVRPGRSTPVARSAPLRALRSIQQHCPNCCATHPSQQWRICRKQFRNGSQPQSRSIISRSATVGVTLSRTPPSSSSSSCVEWRDGRATLRGRWFSSVRSRLTLTFGTLCFSYTRPSACPTRT